MDTQIMTKRFWFAVIPFAVIAVVGGLRLNAMRAEAGIEPEPFRDQLSDVLQRVESAERKLGQMQARFSPLPADESGESAALLLSIQAECDAVAQIAEEMLRELEAPRG